MQAMAAPGATSGSSTLKTGRKASVSNLSLPPFDSKYRNTNSGVGSDSEEGHTPASGGSGGSAPNGPDPRPDRDNDSRTEKTSAVTELAELVKTLLINNQRSQVPIRQPQLKDLLLDFSDRFKGKNVTDFLTRLEDRFEAMDVMQEGQK
jgi:hypothetical protein